MADQFELKRGRWTKKKVPQSDLLYCIDLTKFLAGAILSRVLSTVTQGVEVTASAVIDGSKVVVKLTGLDTAEAAMNFCRFSLKCTNGEEFEATLWFEPY